MTQKLYYEDQYIKEFSSEVIDIIEKENEFHIQLDKTAFFPGGNNQPCDIGIIEDCLIASVYEKDDIIYHISNKRPIKKHRVKCKIDWEYRFDAMQQHLGQHLLTSAFLELFNSSTVSFNLGKDFCFIEIDKLLSDYDLEMVEALVNKNIYESKVVELLTPTKSELKKLNIKHVSNMNKEALRIVKIDGIDVAASSGLYLKSTIEIQFMKLLKKEKIKDHLRVYFICGKRAIQESLKKHKTLDKICKGLNCNEDDALIKVDSLTSQYNTILAENKNLKTQIADFQVQNILNSCKNINSVRIVKNIYETNDMKYITLLSSKLTSFENVVVLHALKSDGIANLLFTCSKDLKIISMNDLLKDAISLIDGKGGGSYVSAQGAGKGINNLESAMDYAFTKVITILGDVSK
jgi:alanyl-tRNA synthetase